MEAGKYFPANAELLNGLREADCASMEAGKYFPANGCTRSDS